MRLCCTILMTTVVLICYHLFIYFICLNDSVNDRTDFLPHPSSDWKLTAISVCALYFPARHDASPDLLHMQVICIFTFPYKYVNNCNSCSLQRNAWGLHTPDISYLFDLVITLYALYWMPSLMYLLVLCSPLPFATLF